MDISKHDMYALFQQLGLPNSQQDVDAFIEKYRPLGDSVRLDEAPFWNHAQAAFLEAAIAEDSDWCEVVDELDASLR